MKKLVLDGIYFKSIHESHQYLKEMFNLSDDYAENLEALWGEISINKEPLEIVLIHEHKMRQSLGDYADRIIEVFADLTQYNQTIYFTRNCKSELED